MQVIGDSFMRQIVVICILFLVLISGCIGAKKDNAPFNAEAGNNASAIRTNIFTDNETALRVQYTFIKKKPSHISSQSFGDSENTEFSDIGEISNLSDQLEGDA